MSQSANKDILKVWKFCADRDMPPLLRAVEASDQQASIGVRGGSLPDF